MLRTPHEIAQALTTALAVRLDAVVPRPVTVRADGITLVIDCGDGTWSRRALDWPFADDPDEPDGGAPLADRIVPVVLTVLDSLQDNVSETTREQWPALPGGGMAPPHVRADTTRVYLWYGVAEDAAVLSFPPIAVAELIGNG